MSHKNPLSLTTLQFDCHQTQYSEFTALSQLQVLYSRVRLVVQAEFVDFLYPICSLQGLAQRGYIVTR